MQLSANNIEHILLISCALYVFVECFACARQVIAAERGIGKVPTGFRNKLSLAAHQKAAAFTSESAQSRLVLAFVSAAFAVLMTTGHGLTYLTALFETLTDNTLLVQWSLLVSIMGLMVVVSLPLEWLIRYRLRERFGYQRRSRKEWFKRTVGISTAGLAAALPATALLLILCEVTGPYWWLLVWMLYLAWLFWRWRLSLMRGKLWSRASRPIQNEALRRKVRSLLAEEGFRMEDLVIMTRPPAWKYAHVLLPGSGELRRVVVFADTAAKLTEDELLAVIASQAARIKFHHGPGALRSRQQGVLSPVLYSAGPQTRRYFLKGLDSHLFSPSCSPAHTPDLPWLRRLLPSRSSSFRCGRSTTSSSGSFATPQTGAARQKWAAIRSHGHSPSFTATTPIRLHPRAFIRFCTTITRMLPCALRIF